MADETETSDAGEMEIERAIGEMLVVGFEGDGDTPPDPVRDALEEGRLGGVILFERNIRSLEQVIALNEHVHELASSRSVPPFVAIDQEGGRVQRLREGVTEVPPMRTIGESGDVQEVADVSETIARELRTLGFNLNFAPVLDVDTNPDNPVIGDRAFGDDPNVVGRAGGAYLYGHNLAGVVPCGKHFPGHGDTDVDSHRDLPVVMKTLDQLRQLELIPFEVAIGAGVPMIMTGHLSLPALDAARPATFSPAVIDELLRLELGFDGVVVSDDLEMAAVADRYDVEEMIDLALEVTLDLFLICHSADTWRRAFDRLLERAEQDSDCRERIRASARRVRDLKQDFFGHQPQPWRRPDDWRDRLGDGG